MCRACKSAAAPIVDEAFKEKWSKEEERAIPKFTEAKPLFLKVGELCDARDVHGSWYVSRIVAIRYPSVLVHFLCWSVLFDEWLDLHIGDVMGLHGHTLSPRSSVNKYVETVSSVQVKYI
jgi:hypothetical protein